MENRSQKIVFISVVPLSVDFLRNNKLIIMRYMPDICLLREKSSLNQIKIYCKKGRSLIYSDSKRKLSKYVCVYSSK